MVKGWLAGLGLLLLLGLALAAGYWLGGREAVKRSAEIDRLGDVIKFLRADRDSLAHVLAVSQAQAETVWTTRWLPTKAKVESLPVDRPVPYPVYVETVHAADTTINACRRALHDCGAVVAKDSALIDTLQRRTALLEQQAAGPRVRLTGNVETHFNADWYLGATLKTRLPLVPLAAYVTGLVRLDSAGRELRAGGEFTF